MVLSVKEKAVIKLSSTYDIHVLQQDAKHDRRGQRSINGVIGFCVPDEKMRDKASLYMKSGKPTHRKERTAHSDFDIIAQYQSEFRGFAQYYLFAYNECASVASPQTDNGMVFSTNPCE